VVVALAGQIVAYAVSGDAAIAARAVAWLSAEPGPEPLEARAWREGRPGLLAICGGLGPG